MKALGLWLGLWVVALLPVSAQVTVEVTQDQDQFLPAEAVPTAVRITNRSGQSLRLGREQDWLTFSVQSRGDEVVPKSGEVPVAGEFVLESSKVATKRVDLAPYFSLEPFGPLFRDRHGPDQRLEPGNHQPAQELRYHRGSQVVGAGNRGPQRRRRQPTPRRKSGSSSCSRPITSNRSFDFMCA